jgi:hypothetical protein
MVVASARRRAMTPLMWACATLVVLGAAMLLVGLGEPLVWIAVTLVAAESFVLAVGGRQPGRQP